MGSILRRQGHSKQSVHAYSRALTLLRELLDGGGGAGGGRGGGGGRKDKKKKAKPFARMTRDAATS